MEYVWFIVSGVVAGIFGGMGMGGGTFLIPLLTIFNGVGQHTAQAVNLISFIPMAVIAIVIHLKNKIIKFDKILLIIIPGLFSCFFGFYLSKNLTGNILSKVFGGFLIALSVFQFISSIKKDENTKL